jgi:hypothetical protein
VLLDTFRETEERASGVRGHPGLHDKTLSKEKKKCLKFFVVEIHSGILCYIYVFLYHQLK